MAGDEVGGEGGEEVERVLTRYRIERAKSSYWWRIESAQTLGGGGGGGGINGEGANERPSDNKFVSASDNL